jgi:hypothetical protein|uniref:Uncharacterized protein n=1 Tax=viral metagenome TaxID=1070528 RepID=A0A6C0M0J0_9ZZZZ
MLFLISDLAFSAAFKIGVWVLKQTYTGVSYVVNAAVAAYGHGTTDQESGSKSESEENDFQCLELD